MVRHLKTLINGAMWSLDGFVVGLHGFVALMLAVASWRLWEFAKSGARAMGLTTQDWHSIPAVWHWLVTHADPAYIALGLQSWAAACFAPFCAYLALLAAHECCARLRVRMG